MRIGTTTPRVSNGEILHVANPLRLACDRPQSLQGRRAGIHGG